MIGLSVRVICRSRNRGVGGVVEEVGESVG